MAQGVRDGAGGASPTPEVPVIALTPWSLVTEHCSILRPVLSRESRAVPALSQVRPCSVWVVSSIPGQRQREAAQRDLGCAPRASW